MTYCFQWNYDMDFMIYACKMYDCVFFDVHRQVHHLSSRSISNNMKQKIFKGYGQQVCVVARVCVRVCV